MSTAIHSATYSPDDNKLRLYPAERLSQDEYERVREAGFRWAPKQQLFVAPMWTPYRAALMIELAGEIEDEDTSLVERAEERAERFLEYSDSNKAAAESARQTVDAIADNIPFGQPILVGHHSEKRARKDAERIENGMRRSLKLWDTANYWKDRAAGALANAKYKEKPAVRHRRIKRISSDLRKALKTRDNAIKFLELWSKPELTLEQARQIANYDGIWKKFPLDKYPRELPASQYEGEMSLWSALGDGIVDVAGAKAIATRVHESNISHQLKWIEHYENRLTYERAMLDDSGGLKADEFELAVGGQVLFSSSRGKIWATVMRVNKSQGEISSVSTNHTSYPRVVPLEGILDYRPADAETAKAVKAKAAPLPLCNYRGEEFKVDYRYRDENYTIAQVEMTKAEYAKIYRDRKGTKVIDGTHRIRIYYQGGAMSAVFLTDQKEKFPPKASPRAQAAPLPAPQLDAELAIADAKRRAAARERRDSNDQQQEYENLRHSLRTGTAVQTVTADQLFVTPKELGEQVVELADIQPGQRVLEPSAGTGSLIGALGWTWYADGGELTAVEINQQLAAQLQEKFPAVKVHQADFLATNGEIGTFDRIVMNPPFGKGADIKHVLHAREKLNPGGRLVAIVANGPRQQEQLKPLAEEWIDLPAGSFKQAGTNVNAAIVVMAV